MLRQDQTDCPLTLLAYCDYFLLRVDADQCFVRQGRYPLVRSGLGSLVGHFHLGYHQILPQFPVSRKSHLGCLVSRQTPLTLPSDRLHQKGYLGRWGLLEVRWGCSPKACSDDLHH